MSASIAPLPFETLLAQVAAKSPTPGGGAVAGATGALAAALAQMVVAYSIGKKSLAEHQDELTRAQAYLERARAIFLELAREDAEAYGLANELQKLPESDPRRQRELPAALEAATQVPMAAIATSADLLRECERLAAITNPYLHSDLAMAAVLAEATARASVWNVRVNAAQLADAAARGSTLKQAETLAAECSTRRAAVETACRH